MSKVYVTLAQARVYDWLKDYIREHGWAPTRAELARGMKFASQNAAHEHLAALAKAGAIRMQHGARCIALLPDVTVWVRW